MTGYLLVALGSALGGMARYWLSGVVARRIGETFPWGTMIVNISGCFVIGVFAALTGPGGGADGDISLRQFAMTGLCGGYTTFSSFSLQTLNLARDGEWLPSLANILGSVMLCLAAVWLGFTLAVFTGEG